MAKKQKMKSELVKIVTPEFRASFPALFEAKAAMNSDKPKYSVQMLFRVAPNPAKPANPDEKPVDLTQLKNAVKAVVVEKFGNDPAKWPKVGSGVGELQLPFRDGNEPGKKDKEGYGPGVIFATASSDPRWNPPPKVFHPYAGADGRPALLTVPTDVYGGMYARATVNPYYWEYMGKLGVSLGLQHVQKLRDGETFSGRGSAENDFDAIPPADGGIAAPAGAAVGDPLFG